MNATVIVDWPLFRSNPYTQDFVSTRVGHAHFVLVVPDPVNDDFDWNSHLPIETATDILHPVPEIEWAAVIRNSGALENVKFKELAFSVVRDASYLEPVIGLDSNTEVNKMYKQNGILITVEDI